MNTPEIARSEVSRSAEGAKSVAREYRLYKRSIHDPSNEELSERRKQARSRTQGKVSDHIQVREHIAPNWFTTRGVLLKRSQIEARGVPDLYQWRFITLTIDPAPFENRGEGPLEAYLAGKEKMRRFMEDSRNAGLWSKGTPWAWKLEFHKSGWPHWHLLVGRLTPFSYEELQETIPGLWKLGGTDVEMVRNDSFLYSFKYAFKPIRIDGSDMDTLSWSVPQWFLDYSGFKMVKVRDTDGKLTEVQKPETFQRVRFWQTSTNFYTGVKRELREPTEPQTSMVPRTVREMANAAASTIQVVSRRRCGRYLKSAVILLGCTTAHLWHVAAWHAVGRNACFLSVNNAVIPTHILNQNTKQPWQIQHLLKQNRLTLRQADKLQARAETLRRC